MASGSWRIAEKKREASLEESGGLSYLELMEHIKVSLSKALTDKGFSATKTASLTSYGRSKSGEPTIQWHYHLHLNGKSPDSGARLKLLRDYANTGGYDELL